MNYLYIKSSNMKILRFFSLTTISVLIITGCTNTETSDSTLGAPIEEQIDTIPMEDKNDEKANKSTSTNQVNADNETSNKPIKKETVNKPQPVKTKTYSFIVADAGKQVADDFKGDLMTTAATEVYIEKKGKCGFGDCGKEIVIVNANPDKSIEATVQISWKENDGKVIKKRRYILKGNQKMEIGCSSMCDTEGTKIKWSIIGAVYN